MEPADQEDQLLMLVEAQRPLQSIFRMHLGQGGVSLVDWYISYTGTDHLDLAKIHFILYIT
jgi:hypothetical protein